MNNSEVVKENNVFYIIKNGKVHNEHGPAMIGTKLLHDQMDLFASYIGIPASMLPDEFIDRTITWTRWFIDGDDITDRLKKHIEVNHWPSDHTLWTKKQWTIFKLKFV